MAASLRNGLTGLFQHCKTLSRAAVSVSWLGPSMAGNAVRSISRPNLLSSSIVKSCFGSRSPAWHTAHQRLPKQATLPLLEQVRTKVRYSRNMGKPKTVHSVPDRFYRLNWGIWIRTRAGRKKKLWKKMPGRKYRLRQHVFCNKTQSKLLDKMVTEFWHRPKYWVDDPYKPYHERQNFNLYYPQRSRPFFP